MKCLQLLFRRSVAVFLAILLAAPAASARPDDSASIKEQVLLIRPGSSVEIHLTDKSKMRGRLGAVTDSGFELQAVTNDKIATQQVPFDRVRSITDKAHQSFGRSVGRGFLVAGIVIGVIIAIGAVACAASNCSG